MLKIMLNIEVHFFFAGYIFHSLLYTSRSDIAGSYVTLIFEELTAPKWLYHHKTSSGNEFSLHYTFKSTIFKKIMAIPLKEWNGFHLYFYKDMKDNDEHFITHLFTICIIFGRVPIFTPGLLSYLYLYCWILKGSLHILGSWYFLDILLSHKSDLQIFSPSYG